MAYIYGKYFINHFLTHLLCDFSLRQLILVLTIRPERDIISYGMYFNPTMSPGRAICVKIYMDNLNQII